MNSPRRPHPVSDTAALVMLWAEQYYRKNPLIRDYLDRLDLSAGKDLVERYNRVCPWYSEVIINRKYFIRETVRVLIEQHPGSTTVVNLGAGFSPLALELSHLLSPQCRFIEIDERNMEQKYALYQDLVPERCRYISCTGGDVTDIPSLTRDLSAVSSPHLVIVMEGLTYYVPRTAMVQVISSLSEFAGLPGTAGGSGSRGALTVLFEHLKPCHLINKDRRFIPYRIFSDVRDYTGLDRMTTYSSEGIQALFPPGFSCNYVDMDQMERQRTGSNQYFPTPDAGWLSCAVLRHASDAGKGSTVTCCSM